MGQKAPEPMNISCEGCENFDHLCLNCRTRRFDLITKHMNPARREVALQREQLILKEFPEVVNLVTDDDQATIDLTGEEEELYWEEAEAQELADADAELDDDDDELGSESSDDDETHL